MKPKENNHKEKYEEKRHTKRVSFNTETEKELLEKANSIDNFSSWVKDRLRNKNDE